MPPYSFPVSSVRQQEGASIMKLTGSQIFVEVLVEQGVDTLFGYPGGAVLNLFDALYAKSGPHPSRI